MRAGALSNRTIRLFAYLRRPVKPRVREGQGRGVQWRHGLGQDACQGRGRIAVQPEGTTRLPVSGKGPGEGRPCGSRIAISSPRQGRAGPGRAMAARAGARCVSGQGQACRTAGRHHAVAHIREGAGGGTTLWKPDRRFEPASGEGRGRGVQWRRGLGQDACQGRHSLLSENYISTV